MRISVCLIGLLTVIAVTGCGVVPAHTRAPGAVQSDDRTMNSDDPAPTPPIDLDIPDVLETATFALG